MENGCLICNCDLEYLSQDVKMECELCHKEEDSKTRCVNGHYVCNECHMKGLDSIINICLNENSKNPITILENLMTKPFCHMHGPEHHIIVGASLLTAYKNAGGNIDLKESLFEMINRAKSVPGGSCGYWGACGAGISTGIFISIISNSTPLSIKSFKLSNYMTSKSLEKIAQHGGPRCCKRDSYISILTAIDFVDENFNIKMHNKEIVCNFSSFNKQCIKEKCIFYKKN